MPVTWNIDGPILTLSVTGVLSNEEISRAFDEAVANTSGKTALRLLWDARHSQTPVTSADMAWRFELVSSLAKRNVISRAALLVGREHRLLLELARGQIQPALPGIESAVFSEPTEALAWLESSGQLDAGGGRGWQRRH